MFFKISVKTVIVIQTSKIPRNTFFPSFVLWFELDSSSMIIASLPYHLQKVLGIDQILSLVKL